MTIKENKIENATILLKLEVDLGEIDNFRNEAYKYYRDNFSFNGFRKGKASNEIIEKRFGRAKIVDFAARFYILDFLKKFLAEKEIKQISYEPSVKIMNDILKDGKAIFNIEIYLVPSVELGDYRNIKIGEGGEEKVSDKEIEAVIYEVRRAYASRNETTEPVKKGDLVTLHYKISFKNNLLPNEEKNNFVIKIGDGRLFKDFEDNILGLRKGEEKSFIFVFPEDYFDKKLRGLTANVWFKLLKVEVEELPELTDEFVKKISQHHNVGEFIKAVKKQIEANKKDWWRKKVLNEKVRKIIDSSSFAIPLIFYDEEKKVILSEIKKELEAKGRDSKAWFQKNLENKEIAASIEKEAVYRVKARLVLEEIAKKENLLPSHQEVTNFLNHYVKYAYNEKEADEYMKKDNMRRLVTSLLMQQKASAFLVSS